MGVIPYSDLGDCSLVFYRAVSMIELQKFHSKFNYHLRSRLLDQTKVCGCMKRIKEKSRRIVKYWRVRYKQASGKERVFMGMYVLTMLAYVWWAMLIF